MHKPHTLAAAGAPPKARRNRKRRDWNKTIRRFCAIALLAELAVALLANPYLRVSKVRVDGAQTVAVQDVFRQARVPDRTNIFVMALREPFARRLETNPVVESAARTIELPDTLVLTVRERQPYAIFESNGAYWMLDKNGVAFRQMDAPPPGLPVIEAPDTADGNGIVPGRRLTAAWLPDAYALLALLDGKKNLEAVTIKVDQNFNLCLNRGDNLQIRLGQPEELPHKVALAQAAVAAGDGSLARSAAYIDVSCPDHLAWMPRKAGRESFADHGRVSNLHSP